MELVPVGTLSKGSNNKKIDDTHFSFREKIFLKNIFVPQYVCVGIKTIIAKAS